MERKSRVGLGAKWSASGFFSKVLALRVSGALFFLWVIDGWIGRASGHSGDGVEGWRCIY
jgi:hypothetical protein